MLPQMKFLATPQNATCPLARCEYSLVTLLISGDICTFVSSLYIDLVAFYVKFRFWAQQNLIISQY